MAFPWNGQPTATTLTPTVLSAHQKLSHFAPFPHDSVKHDRAQAVQVEKFRNFNPQACHQILATSPHQTTRQPKREKRSVNSFMAFRSFYKPMFPKLQQKDASTFLTTMWKSEPFKAKWTIIAKAYSRIRDAVGKQHASLVTYLTLVCPKIGIIDAEDYFGKMNWSFETAADGTKILKQATFPDLSCFGTNILYTNMTPKDIIHFCAQIAYIPQHIAIRISSADLSNVVGTLRPNQMPQQSLLASYPILPQGDKSASVLEAGVVRSSSTTPQLAGTSVGEFPISFNASDENYQWTGSMCDLYKPAEGSIDLDSMIGDQETSLCYTASICIPQSLDSLVQNRDVCDGYIHPSVPNHETQNHFGSFQDKL